MPLQKSHSDLNYSSKGPNYPRQPNWSRSKSHSAALSGPSKVVISEATKSKLQQFTFDRQDVLEDEADPGPPTSSQKENITNEKTANPTATPSNRPSWSDLLTVTEKSSEKSGQVARPILDTIGWNVSASKKNSRIPQDMSPVWSRRNTRNNVKNNTKNTRKRARSSSPVSSPVSCSQTPTTANIKKLARAARSPYADPTTELWDRYVLGNKGKNKAGTGDDASNPKGAGLMSNLLFGQATVSSSPRPHKSGEAAFRRTTSCGTNWPKRRKTERTMENSSSRLAAADNECHSISTRLARTSMVAEILETVNVEIESKISRGPAFELLSSPSPAERSKHGAQTVSRSRSRSPSRDEDTGGALPQLAAPENAGLGISPSSDYGDDDFDFDEDTLMELDVTLVPTHHNAEECGPQAALPNMPYVAAEPLPLPGPAIVAHVAPVHVPAGRDEEDEFGDLDDDVFDTLEASINDKSASPDSPREEGLQTRDESSTMTAGTTVLHGDDDYGDDDFGDDFGDDFDFNAVELAATQAVAEKAAGLQSREKSRIIQRYLVTKVVAGYYPNARGQDVPETILVVEVEKTKKMRTIYLREDWVDTPVNVNAYVHVIGIFDHDKCIIDNTRHILILHPDQLISSTVVADSFSCTRRAVLQDRVKATSDPSAPLVYGSMLHEIFQEALIENNWSNAFLYGIIERNAHKHVEDLYSIKVSLEDAQSHLKSKMSELQSWAERFVTAHPKPNAIVNGRNGDKAAMSITKLLEVEEHVWSPMYGLKGNIDATVEVKMQEGKTQRTLTVPFEVKTGKRETTSHQTQTVLYNLLLSDRYDIEVAYGVLYYMESSKTLRIPAIRHELRHMIMQRNRLACHLRDRNAELPEMKRNQNMCGNCYAKTSCFIYHKLADNGDGKTSGMDEKFDEVVGHLKPIHQEFFLKWEGLLTKEEKETQKLKRELWTMLGPERERLGRCLAGVVIEEGSAGEEKDGGKINRYRYTFIKDDQDGRLDPKFSFIDSQLAVGEPIVVSSEEGHFALALGFVTTVRKTKITVAVDRRLHQSRIRQPGFDEENNQVFTGIMEVVPRSALSTQQDEKPARFRLDKDEFNNGMATVRNNLIQTMAGGPFGQHIRRLVVDLDLPRFKEVATQYTIAAHDSLNTDQKRAIEKVMSAQDYALVLGMPGTGKTTTIAHIIRALVAQGKSVLLTSYTHTAVDNILLKLKDDKLPILRLGAVAKVHPEVQNFVTLAGQGMTTFQSIDAAWHGSPIVATTCLGISHPLFQERRFDYCIVDEASQITLPICLGPIRMAMRFVLVGDHYQLPPLVKNEEARKGGLDVSLFKLLSDSCPEGVVNLTHQYRMCEDIMSMSNTLIYNGRLKCGTEELKDRMLHVPNMHGLQALHYGAASSQQPMLPPPGTAAATPCVGPTDGSRCWLQDVLAPSARVRFINTDGLGEAARESSKGNRIVNPSEVSIVTSLVLSLLSVGIPAEEIGVMTHYRSQLSLLKHSLGRHLGAAGAAAVEMHTADRFQGRDKEVVVLSLVRSNEAGSIGELLKDWRRINVAFTRAKTKLLVVGSRNTLRGNGTSRGGASGQGQGKEKGQGGVDGQGQREREAQEGDDGMEMVSKVVQMMEEKKWVYDLPECALNDHLFEEVLGDTPFSGCTNNNKMAEERRHPTKAVTQQLLGWKKDGPSNGNGEMEVGSGRRRQTEQLAGGQTSITTKTKHVQPRKARMGGRAIDSALKRNPVLRNVLDEFLS